MSVSGMFDVVLADQKVIANGMVDISVVIDNTVKFDISFHFITVSQHFYNSFLRFFSLTYWHQNKLKNQWQGFYGIHWFA